MISDYHLHTFFSGDSKADPHVMADRAIELGMESICFTDHMDTDSEDPGYGCLYSLYAGSAGGIQRETKGPDRCRDRHAAASG